MSKLGDVRSMYGQDLGIGVTNAPSNVLKQYSKLTKNMLLISSPVDDEGNDIGLPSLFATDYNGNQMQLTYAIHTINGLYPNSEGNLQLFIDGKSIKEKDKQLYVDTNNLTYCSFNNLGVAKVSKAVSSRTNSAYPIDTFINVDRNGVLYLSDTFLSHIYEYIATKIYDNLYLLIMDNIKAWLVDQDSIKYYPTDKISIIPIDPNYGITITKNYTLQYNSLNNISEEVVVDINNNDYPIKEVIFTNNTTTVTEDSTSTKEIKVYRHTINFTIVFYPNYNLQNNIFLDNQYQIRFRPQSLEDNQMIMFYFNQNNAFDNDSNVVFKPFNITTSRISLNQLRNGRDIEFIFENKYKYFEDVDYNLEILYIKSGNENNIDDAVSLLNLNINNNIETNSDTVEVTLSKQQEDLESDVYSLWKNCLISVDENTNVITKLSDASNLYKYILTYTINGERSYTYEDTFIIKYLLTNIYKNENYFQLNNTTGISIYEVSNASNPENSNYTISGGSLINSDDIKSVIISQKDNKIIITAQHEFIYRIFERLFEKDSLNEESDSSIWSSDGITSTLVNGETKINNSQNYANEVGFLLVFDGNFIDDIFITNSGEDNNQEEYTIYNAIRPGIPSDLISSDNALPIIIRTDEGIGKPNYAQYHSIVYPNYSQIKSNSRSIHVLSYIKLDDFIYQNSSSNTREFSSSTNKLYYNFALYNSQGPTNYISFIMDYGEFIASHIKVFRLSYGAWHDPFNPGQGEPIYNMNNGNNIMEEIGEGEEYGNSRFYIGIKEDLINRVFENSQVQVVCEYQAISSNGEQTTIETGESVWSTSTSGMTSRLCHKPSDNCPNEFEGSRYYMFEINYVDKWYIPATENGQPVTTSDGDQIYQPKPQITIMNPYVKIKYKWRKQQDNSVVQTFNYKIPFKLVTNIEEPEIIDTGRILSE